MGEVVDVDANVVVLLLLGGVGRCPVGERVDECPIGGAGGIAENQIISDLRQKIGVIPLQIHSAAVIPVGCFVNANPTCQPFMSLYFMWRLSPSDT